ncbi:MAG TPA: FAD-dependent oxidoreductase [Ottowia sp.]|nr:FAD-dependent oxidoreductase [Ottowia sp.]
MTAPLLVVGAGFAGFWAAVAASRVLDGAVPVTLVAPSPVLQLRPRLYQARPETLGLELRPLLAQVGVGYLAATAIGIDAAASQLPLEDDKRLPFTRLVVATGSVMRRPPILGADLALSIDTQAEAIVVDQRLRALALADASPRIVVVGAGFTGLELVLALRDRLDAHRPGAGNHAQLTLVDRGAWPGQALGEGPRAAIADALAAAAVHLRMGAAVAAITPHGLTLDGGEAIAADLVLLSTGMVAAGFSRQVPSTHDALGRVQVDVDLRAPAAPAVFVIGDAAAADTGDGHLALQSCQHALQLGRVAGENAALDLLGRPTRAYAQPRYVTCLDLGRSGAVFTEGWDRVLVDAGAAMGQRKRDINEVVIYPPVGADRDALLAASRTST